MATSEVLLKIPSFSFNEDKLRLAPPASDPAASKVAQLENNMRFLREQHQVMLSSLHKEVDNLRLFNRELQFQLVMSGAAAKMSALSIEVPADLCVTSEQPKRANDVSRLELLEKSLAEMRIGLNEEKGRNKQLCEVVREQQRKLEQLKTAGVKLVPTQRNAMCQVEEATPWLVESTDRFTQTYRNSENWSKDPRRSGNRFRRSNSGRFSNTSSVSQDDAHQPPLQMFPPLHAPVRQQQPTPRPRTSVDKEHEKLPALAVGEPSREEQWPQGAEQTPHSERVRRRRYRNKRTQREQN